MVHPINPYMSMGGWSEGAVNNTEEEFKNYVITEAEKYNNLLRTGVGPVEKK